MPIACENEWYLYQKDGRCRLSEIGINAAGFCDPFILVSCPPTCLEKHKQAQLKRLNDS